MNRFYIEAMRLLITMHTCLLLASCSVEGELPASSPKRPPATRSKAKALSLKKITSRTKTRTKANITRQKEAIQQPLSQHKDRQAPDPATKTSSITKVPQNGSEPAHPTQTATAEKGRQRAQETTGTMGTEQGVKQAQHNKTNAIAAQPPQSGDQPAGQRCFIENRQGEKIWYTVAKKYRKQSVVVEIRPDTPMKNYAARQKFYDNFSIGLVAYNKQHQKIPAAKKRYLIATRLFANVRHYVFPKPSPIAASLLFQRLVKPYPPRASSHKVFRLKLKKCGITRPSWRPISSAVTHIKKDDRRCIINNVEYFLFVMQQRYVKVPKRYVLAKITAQELGKEPSSLEIPC